MSLTTLKNLISRFTSSANSIAPSNPATATPKSYSSSVSSSSTAATSSLHKQHTTITRPYDSTLRSPARARPTISSFFYLGSVIFRMYLDEAKSSNSTRNVSQDRMEKQRTKGKVYVRSQYNDNCAGMVW